MTDFSYSCWYYLRDKNISAWLSGNCCNQNDNDVLGRVIAALKESHADSRKYHADRITGLQTQYYKLQRRLEAMYEDKFYGRIDQDFYDRKMLVGRMGRIKFY